MHLQPDHDFPVAGGAVDAVGGGFVGHVVLGRFDGVWIQARAAGEKRVAAFVSR
jgi:hypothetical protein